MKKTISVTIGGLVFNLEEDAYVKLSEYLESLKKHFASLAYGKEVVSDIETRIAEQFNTKTGGNSNKAITIEDVEQIIKSIGRIEDFTDTEKSETKAEEPQSSSRKLYRNSDDVIIAGVASGIAAYFGWDSTLVRIVFGLSVIFGGWGIPLYILLWIVMPEAKSSSQKLEMQGIPVTAKQIEKNVREKITEVKESGFFRRLFGLLGTIIKGLVKIILGITGAAFIFGAIVAALSVTFVAANLLINKNSPYMDSAVVQAFNGAEYYLLTILAYLTVAIPLVLLALVGIKLMKFNFTVNKTVPISLIVIWWIAAPLGASLAFRAAPRIEAAVQAYQGNIETRQIQAENFSKIDASSSYKLNITQGEEYTVSLGTYKGFRRN